MKSSIEYVMDRIEGERATARNEARDPASPARSATLQGHQQAQVCRIDLDVLEEKGYLAPEKQRTQVAEEIRAIKRPVIRNAQGKGAAQLKNGNIVMIVSALEGEGKTFTTLNLAMSMAQERDNTVLLVDGDVIKGSMTRLLGLQQSYGLTDMLLDPDMSVARGVVKTSVPSLSVVPAGNYHEHAPELLSSRRMAGIVLEIAERYKDRIILIDSPPLLLTNEAKVLAEYAGQILIVVEEGVTERAAIEDAVALIKPYEAADKVIGFVMNKQLKMAGSRGYYYSYGKKGGEEKKAGR